MDGEDATSPADIRARALALLARREHSRQELLRKLRQRGFAEAALLPVLEELAVARLQSDTRYAESYARSRAERGFGPLRIRAELQERGIDASGIDAALAGLEADWGLQACEAREKRFGGEPPQDLKQRARQTRFLLQRGFSHEQVRAALLPD